MFRIGELAQATGETVKTLRYWTDQGLLQAARGDNRYRYYAPGSTERIAFIRSAQALGFSLTEIRNVLEHKANDISPCATVRIHLYQHLKEVRQHIDRLQRLEQNLKRSLHFADTVPSSACDGEGCIYLTQSVRLA
jgi:MerR family copper efflux transcriptional regulator